MITHHKIDFTVLNDTNGIVPISNGVTSFALSKSINDFQGKLNIKLTTDYANDLENLNANDFGRLYVDDKLVFEGLCVKPTSSGQINPQGKVSRSMSINCIDAGYIFDHICKPYIDIMQTKHFAFSKVAMRKFADAYLENRDINSYSKNIYDLFIQGIGEFVGGDYTLANRQTILNAYPASSTLMIAKDANFFHQLPMQINFMQSQQSLIDYLKIIADTSFSEIWGDTYSNGDLVSLGDSIPEPILEDGYKIVIRPKPFDSSSSLKLYNITNAFYDIGDAHWQWGLSKDATQSYNAFIVSNSALGWNANKGIAIGGVKVNQFNAQTYGYRLLKIDIKAFFQNSDDFMQELDKLTDILKDWYEDSPDFIYGQISFPYNKDARIGKRILFKLPNDTRQYEGYTEQLDTIFDINEARLHQVATITRGRAVY